MAPEVSEADTSGEYTGTMGEQIGGGDVES